MMSGLQGPVRLMLFIGFGFCAVMVMFLGLARYLERKGALAAGRQDDGRVLGVVGLPGDGKTSFIVGHYVIPALRQGRTVITNFDVFAEELPGKWLLLEAETFAEDLLGIGSSLNRHKVTGEPMSGWFVDTACTCGKDHDVSCSRPGGDVPAGRACCRGFRARRLCDCNGVVVVTDEAASYLPANQSKQLPLELLNYFTMIRKNHLFFIWSAQFWKWIHASVRRLTRQGIVCSRGLLASERVARMYDVDPQKAEMVMSNVLTTVKFNPKTLAGGWYDSGEVIVATETAFELMGQMSRRHVPGSGARHEHAAPQPAPVVPLRAVE